MEPEPVVRLTHNGRLFTFRVDPDPPLAFWRVESEGRTYTSPLRSATSNPTSSAYSRPPPFGRGIDYAREGRPRGAWVCGLTC
jgi:hypothetical protein